MKHITNTYKRIRYSYIGYTIVLILYFVFAFTVKLPILASEPEKATLFQSSGIITLVLYIILITIIYGGIVYFIPFKDLADQLKSYQHPLRATLNTKFEYWIKSLLHEDVLKEEQHLNEVSRYINERAIGKIDVLKHAAELQNMTTETFVKLLEGQAQANFINSKGDTEKAHSELLREAVHFISKMTPMWQAYTIAAIFGTAPHAPEDLELKKEFGEILKDLKNEELREKKNKNTYDEYRNSEKMKGNEL